MKQPDFKITRIAEALADDYSPTEILKTIAAQRSYFDVAQLAEVLDRAKELQAQAEQLQRKAAILMDIVEQIVKASPELTPAAIGEINRGVGAVKTGVQHASTRECWHRLCHVETAASSRSRTSTPRNPI
jgi:hypothetical protein